MLSATTAERRLSIPPRSVNDTADGSTSITFPREAGGRLGAGREFGIPPYRVPMVSTGSPTSQVTKAASPTAIRKAGQSGR